MSEIEDDREFKPMILSEPSHVADNKSSIEVSSV